MLMCETRKGRVLFDPPRLIDFPLTNDGECTWYGGSLSIFLLPLPADPLQKRRLKRIFQKEVGITGGGRCLEKWLVAQQLAFRSDNDTVPY